MRRKKYFEMTLWTSQTKTILYLSVQWKFSWRQTYFIRILRVILSAQFLKIVIYKTHPKLTEQKFDVKKVTESNLNTIQISVSLMT